MEKRKRRVVALVALLIVLLGVWLLFDTLLSSDEEAAAIEQTQEDVAARYDSCLKVGRGEPAPDFEVILSDGKPLRLSSLRGKTVLLTFFATWCPDCRVELARVPEHIVGRFAGEAFVYLPVSRKERREAVERYWQEQGFDFPFALDTSGAVFALYADNWIPRNFVIDPQGRIVVSGLDYTPEDFAALGDEVARTIAAAEREQSKPHKL